MSLECARELVTEVEKALSGPSFHGRARETAKKVLRKANKVAQDLDLTPAAAEVSTATAHDDTSAMSQTDRGSDGPSSISQRCDTVGLSSEHCQAETALPLEAADTSVKLASIPESGLSSMTSSSVNVEQRAGSTDPSYEIVDLFRKLDLPEDAAQRLIDPNGDYGYSDLVSFAELVAMEDLRGAGLKIAQARKLKKALEPGGEVYNNLVLSRRLVPTKAEPPKCGAAEGAGNPNDGSSTSDMTTSTSSGSTKMTSVRVPRRVRERVEAVAPQLYEQDRLSEMCQQSFSTLSEACSVSRASGLIDHGDCERVRELNYKGNVAKHEKFGRGRQQ